MPHIYAPREPSRELLGVLTKLWAANKSDTCIVSGEKLRELVAAWYGLKRSTRWVWYHLRAAQREHLVIKQTRWRAVAGKLELKARNRYRCGWRQFQRAGLQARSWAKLAALITAPGRRQTVQKIALGLKNLISSVVPESS
jgi:hypothetical protein